MHLLLDFRRADAREICEGYQQLAQLIYGEEALDGVLVKAGHEDPDLHYTLRDIVRTLARAKARPLGLRVAFIGGESVAPVCRVMTPALRELGCELRCFDAEGEAASWLAPP